MEIIQKSELISLQTTTSKDILENVSKNTNPTESQSPLQTPNDQSIGLELTETNRKHIEIEEIDSPISPFDQSVVICHILENNFSLIEQIEMSRVCRLWHDCVEHIWGKARSLVLSMDPYSNKPTMSTKHNRNFEFEYHFADSLTRNNVELTIGQNHWNQPTIDLLGDLFRNIEHLTIFYELSCDFEATQKLCHFLQKYPKIKSFSFLMPVPCHVRMDFLSRLFKMMINAHLNQLHTLHLYLPKFNLPFPALKSKHFHRILSFLQNFSLNCAVENLGEMLMTTGKFLPVGWPMQSLSINISDEKSLSPVSTLFEQNPKLSQIKRLELTDLNDLSLNIVKNLVEHFAQVELLYLKKRPTFYSKIDFTANWIETLSKLPHLKEMHLGDFNIQLYDDHDCMVKSSLSNILKLTIVASYSLDFEIKNQYYQRNEINWSESVEPSLMYSQFVHSLAKQFPKLEQLTIRLIYDNFDKEENFSSLCFTEFYHLKSLRLTGRYRDLTFTS